MTVTARQRIERRIEELEATMHSGAIVAMRAAVGTELIQEWLAGRLFTAEDVADMTEDARKEGYADGYPEGYSEGHSVGYEGGHRVGYYARCKDE